MQNLKLRCDWRTGDVGVGGRSPASAPGDVGMEQPSLDGPPAAARVSSESACTKASPGKGRDSNSNREIVNPSFIGVGEAASRETSPDYT